jgi:two-component system chemotaxis response regulator CheB
MRPAVDVLFRSLAVVRGRRAAGVVLSGMLDDGTAGLWSLKEHGGGAFVQDPSDAQHPDMPRNAMEYVRPDGCASAAALAGLLARWARAAAADETAPTAPLPGHAMETRIANEAHALQAGVMALGPVSNFACPECHGVLVQIEEGNLVRFRCHTGHAYSHKTLLAEVSTAIDSGLWATLRATEERLLLLRQMAVTARRRGALGEAAVRELEAECLEKPITLMRGLVTDEHLFGHADATAEPLPEAAA